MTPGTLDRRDADFGGYLRVFRVRAGRSLADVSQITKIKEATLDDLEHGRIDHLPAQVFVTGFISAFARAVSADEQEALSRYHHHLDAKASRARIEAAREAQARYGNDENESPVRGRLGLAVVVFLILLVATLTLSLLLRRDQPSAGDLSSRTVSGVATFVS